MQQMEISILSPEWGLTRFLLFIYSTSSVGGGLIHSLRVSLYQTSRLLPYVSFTSTQADCCDDIHDWAETVYPPVFLLFPCRKSMATTNGRKCNDTKRARYPDMVVHSKYGNCLQGKYLMIMKRAKSQVQTLLSPFETEVQLMGFSYFFFLCKKKRKKEDPTG